MRDRKGTAAVHISAGNRNSFLIRATMILTSAARGTRTAFVAIYGYSVLLGCGSEGKSKANIVGGRILCPSDRFHGVVQRVHRRVAVQHVTRNSRRAR